MTNIYDMIDDVLQSPYMDALTKLFNRLKTEEERNLLIDTYYDGYSEKDEELRDKYIPAFADIYFKLNYEEQHAVCVAKYEKYEQKIRFRIIN